MHKFLSISIVMAFAFFPFLQARADMGSFHFNLTNNFPAGQGQQYYVIIFEGLKDPDQVGNLYNDTERRCTQQSPCTCYPAVPCPMSISRDGLYRRFAISFMIQEDPDTICYYGYMGDWNSFVALPDGCINMNSSIDGAGDITVSPQETLKSSNRN